MRTVRQVGDWVFSAKRHSTSISPDRRTVLSFDLEGRPLSWFDGGRIYKRSLSGEVYGRERVDGRRRYWRVPGDEAARRCGRLLRVVAVAPSGDLEAALRGRLDGILAWTPERLRAERNRFDEAYRPIGILPPDQYLSVVLQASFGCTWNRCTFCNFYQDQPFRVRSASSFREHCEKVKALLGRGEKLRQRIFLSDGNALVLSDERLLPIFDIARGAFPGRKLYGFVDVYSGERRDPEQWAELARQGLHRVYVGLETGDDELLRWLNKPGGRDEAARFIATLKASGLRVSTILMVGAGGERFAGQHVRNTLDLVSRLPLGKEDIVYLSPFHVMDGSEYARRAAADGIRVLDEAESRKQYEELRDGIRGARPGVKVSRYDLREFIY